MGLLFSLPAIINVLKPRRNFFFRSTKYATSHSVIHYGALLRERSVTHYGVSPQPITEFFGPSILRNARVGILDIASALPLVMHLDEAKRCRSVSQLATDRPTATLKPRANTRNGLSPECKPA